jgi:hypothetical protein
MWSPSAACLAHLGGLVSRAHAGWRKAYPLITRAARICGVLLLLLLACGCADHDHQVIVSIPEQRMAVLARGVPLAVYPVSTSRFGLGDEPGQRGTPLGNLEVAEKIGGGLAPGAVLKSREPTGEVLAVDAPGRDPVVTRILWLRGLEAGNQHAHDRYIYIHGTPEERNIGKPASFGCVRMRSADIIALYDEIGSGARVTIADLPLAVAAAPALAPGATLPDPATGVRR